MEACWPLTEFQGCWGCSDCFKLLQISLQLIHLKTFLIILQELTKFRDVLTKLTFCPAMLGKLTRYLIHSKSKSLQTSESGCPNTTLGLPIYFSAYPPSNEGLFHLGLWPHQLILKVYQQGGRDQSEGSFKSGEKAFHTIPPRNSLWSAKRSSIQWGCSLAMASMDFELQQRTTKLPHVFRQD